jgi:hypothetical protein
MCTTCVRLARRCCTGCRQPCSHARQSSHAVRAEGRLRTVWQQVQSLMLLFVAFAAGISLSARFGSKNGIKTAAARWEQQMMCSHRSALVRTAWQRIPRGQLSLLLACGSVVVQCILQNDPWSGVLLDLPEAWAAACCITGLWY